jgi:hypothetical protein
MVKITTEADSIKASTAMNREAELTLVSGQKVTRK